MAGKRVFGILVVLLLVTPVTLAKMQTIVRKNGRKITGDVAKIETGYEVTTKFGVIVIPFDEVKEIINVVSPKDEYQKKLAGINRSNPNELYGMAEWAFSKKLLSESEKLLQDVLKIDENHLEATLLLKQVQARIKLQKSKAKTVVPGKKDLPTKKSPKLLGDIEKLLISEEDIYRIRMVEAKRNDNVRVKFRNKVIQRFIESKKGVGDFQDQNFIRTFLAYSPARKFRYMVFDEPASEAIKNDILITNDPATLREFRMRIWPLIARGCASSSCHGSNKAKGGLKLFNLAIRDDRVLYTNFAILSGYVFKNGEHLIDRGDTSQSLLLSYGLPQKAAGSSAHPGKIRPLYTSISHRNYRRIESWLEMLYGPDYPNYNLQYKPPFGMKLDFTGTSGTILKSVKPEDKEGGELPGESPKKDDNGKKKEERPPLFD